MCAGISEVPVGITPICLFECAKYQRHYWDYPMTNLSFLEPIALWSDYERFKAMAEAVEKMEPSSRVCDVECIENDGPCGRHQPYGYIVLRGNPSFVESRLMDLIVAHLAEESVPPGAPKKAVSSVSRTDTADADSDYLSSRFDLFEETMKELRQKRTKLPDSDSDSLACRFDLFEETMNELRQKRTKLSDSDSDSVSSYDSETRRRLDFDDIDIENAHDTMREIKARWAESAMEMMSE